MQNKQLHEVKLNCLSQRILSNAHKCNTCARRRIDLLPNALSRLADGPECLPLGFQDVPVLRHHQDGDKIHNSKSQELGLLTVVLWNTTQYEDYKKSMFNHNMSGEEQVLFRCNITLYWNTAVTKEQMSSCYFSNIRCILVYLSGCKYLRWIAASL